MPTAVTYRGRVLCPQIFASLKEARESHYWLRLLAADEVMPVSRLKPLTTEANELVAILTTIVKRSREK